MKSLRWHVILGCAALLAVGPASRAQQGRAFSVGYCYPAGCQQGATSEHIIAGQFLNNVTNVNRPFKGDYESADKVIYQPLQSKANPDS